MINSLDFMYFKVITLFFRRDDELDTLTRDPVLKKREEVLDNGVSLSFIYKPIRKHKTFIQAIDLLIYFSFSSKPVAVCNCISLSSFDRVENVFQIMIYYVAINVFILLYKQNSAQKGDCGRNNQNKVNS